jgi:hypothetical protein
VVGFDAAGLDAGTYVVRLLSDGVMSSRGIVIGVR